MDNKKSDKKRLSIERLFGILLLVPPLLGVFFFVLDLFFNNLGSIVELRNLSIFWTGGYGYDAGSGSGFTSSAPIYLGLMAIAGSILLKGTDKG
jgi:hypothetical protein